MKNVIMFIAGATVGSVATWLIIKEKYKRLADEEIESVVDYFNNKKDESKNIQHSEQTDEVHNDEMVDVNKNYTIVDKIESGEGYKKEVEKLGYFYSDKGVTLEKYTVQVEPGEEVDMPYVISPEEFGELDDYETKSLTFYEPDFVLADDAGELTIDLENTIGEALVHFGDYEEDAVHVRNDDLKCDFEILRVHENFYEDSE